MEEVALGTLYFPGNNSHILADAVLGMDDIITGFEVFKTVNDFGAAELALIASRVMMNLKQLLTRNNRNVMNRVMDAFGQRIVEEVEAAFDEILCAVGFIEDDFIFFALVPEPVFLFFIEGEDDGAAVEKDAQLDAKRLIGQMNRFKIRGVFRVRIFFNRGTSLCCPGQFMPYGKLRQQLFFLNHFLNVGDRLIKQMLGVGFDSRNVAVDDLGMIQIVPDAGWRRKEGGVGVEPLVSHSFLNHLEVIFNRSGLDHFLFIFEHCPCPGENLFDLGIIQKKGRSRNNPYFLQRGNGTLRIGAEVADGVDFITKEFDTDRIFIVDGINIHNAATAGKAQRLIDVRSLKITAGSQFPFQLFHVAGITGLQMDARITEGFRRRQQPQKPAW